MLPVVLAQSLLSPSQMNSFPTISGTQFLLDGKPFSFAGTNCYYLFYAQPSDVDAFFQMAVQIKAPVLRTWLFADGNYAPSNPPNAGGQSIWFQELVNGQVQFNDDTNSGLGRFDYVIESARRHGIKLIVTLSNNWQDFGGADWYVDRLSASKTHSSFYTDPKVRQAFKNYVQHVLERTNGLSGVQYKNDPTIFSIELMNEPRCVGSGRYPSDPQCNTQIITSWVREMSQFVKSLDSKHLVTIGDEGFWNNGLPYDGAYSNVWDGSSGLDFWANAQLSSIDYLGIHTYFDSWGTGDDPRFTNNTLTYILDHALVSKRVQKPIVLGEYGVRSKQMRLQDMPKIQKQCEDSGYAGTLVWMFGSSWYGQQGYPDYDGYTLYQSDPDLQTIFLDHALRMLKQ